MVDQPALAEEILQDTMLAVWKERAPSGAGRECEPGCSHRPAAGPRPDAAQRPIPMADSELAQRPQPEPRSRGDGRRAGRGWRMVAALSTLTPVHREVLGLVFGADLSLAEVARVLEVPLGPSRAGSTRRVPP